ncbi:asparaginase [bacterium]|nr:asparaginase [bacterium]
MTKVFILYTGGTFGMRPSGDPGNRLVPSTWNDILPYMPAIKDQGYFGYFKGIDFTFATLKEPVDSSNIEPVNWKEIAETIQANYEDHSGFVIIHGTDTMAYTASALSFMFEGLNKPIVLTGSQLPVFHPRTDAIVNLSNAIYIAGYQNFDLPCIPEVCICFNDDILRGNRAVKTSTNDFEGFYSPNFSHLGWLEQMIEINEIQLLPPSSEELSLKSEFSRHVVNVTIFPGYNPQVLIDLVRQNRLEGIVLKTFGSGNIPDAPIWKQLVQECEAHNVLILATTQCPNGALNIGKYEASKILISPNVINGYDLTSEAALTKLMWVIGNFPFEERKQYLEQNLRGEMSLS